jgi:hypothetical protein
LEKLIVKLGTFGGQMGGKYGPNVVFFEVKGSELVGYRV